MNDSLATIYPVLALPAAFSLHYAGRYRAKYQIELHKEVVICLGALESSSTTGTRKHMDMKELLKARRNA